MLALSLSPGVAQEDAPQPPRKAAFASTALTGNASLNTAPAVKLLEAAEKANLHRLYKEAAIKYQAVIKEVHRGYHEPKALCLTKIGLAEIALREAEDSGAAIKELTSVLPMCETTFGAKSLEAARIHYGLAEALLAENKLDRAADACKRCLEIRAAAEPDGELTGQALAMQARIELAKGFHKESLETFSKALKILELKSGLDMLDYANTLYWSGIARLGAGDEQGAGAAIEKARGMQDLAVNLNKTPERRGVVHFNWVDGVPECRQVYDSVYPLKYMLIDHLRIAVTLVRSDKHLAAVVSLANCSREPMQVAVGPVVVERTQPGPRSKLFFCDPGLIDMPLEEECVSNLTWRRRWLCHIQKTHRIPGYLKSGALDPDNFYGNNIFGIYGCWDGSLRNAPPVVTREQFFYDSENDKSPSYNDVERFMARSSGGYKPALIEPGDARTGVVFFLRQRYDSARVRVMVGNAVVDFPFQAVAGR